MFICRDGLCALREMPGCRWLGCQRESRRVEARAGVIDAFVLEGEGDIVELQPGVAIVASSTWAALKARQKLQVEWNEADAAKDEWATSSAQSLRLADIDGSEIVAERGDFARSVADASRRIEATYQYAFVSHAQLEPQVCVARMTTAGGCELWPPSQTPQRAQKNVANVLKIDEWKVTIHPVRVGGGFGRRLMNDYACEAAAIAQRLARPVKLQWTREDDMTHDFVRAGGTIGLRAALDATDVPADGSSISSLSREMGRSRCSVAICGHRKISLS